MKKILFVCLGNICRSPVAEAILRDKFEKNSLQSEFSVDSCGTGGWHEGEPPHHGTRAMLKSFAISDERIFARKIHPHDITASDLIFCMDNQNKEDVMSIARKKSLPTDHIHLFLEFTQTGTHHGFEVPDPYYTGKFDEVFAMLDEAADRFIKLIK